MSYGSDFYVSCYLVFGSLLRFFDLCVPSLNSRICKVINGFNALVKQSCRSHIQISLYSPQRIDESKRHDDVCRSKALAK